MALAGALMPIGMARESEVEAALAVMAHGPGRHFSIWRGDGIILGGCDDAQLFKSRADEPERVALFEGHLDNRQEVLRALNLTSGQVCSDAEVLVRAWQYWGEDFLSPLVGRFACILWDGNTRQVVLGCDALGKRPLHHWQGKGLHLFASEPRGLLVQAPVVKEFNQTHIAEILALVPPGPTTTLFAGIERLPPGHLLLVQEGKVRLHRYWQPEHLPLLHLPRSEDYVEALRAALEQAVACRLPADGLVGCQLSAGLDSPSVAAVAARQLAEQGRRLVAFTAVPRTGFIGKPNPRLIQDEGPLAALCAARYPNMDHILIPNNALSLFDAMDRQGASADSPSLNPSNLRWSMAINEEFRRRGLRVMLTGGFGNMSLSYDGIFAPAALLRQGRLTALLPLLWGLRKEGWDWPRVAGAAITPLAPSMRRAYRRLQGDSDPDLFDYSLVNPDLAQQSGVLERARAQTNNIGLSVGADGRAFRSLALRRCLPSAPIKAGIRRLFGIDRVDPLLDRRLFELCLSIPEQQFIQGGEPRSLVRRVMADLLPPELLAERRRGRQAADWYEGLTEAYPEILRELALLEASPIAGQCLDLTRMRQLADNWPQGDWERPEVYSLYAMALPRALSMGRFLRRAESSPTYPLYEE